MPTLEINPDYLQMLILKVRALMAKDDGGDPETGSNPTDDGTGGNLQEGPDDLTREEIVEEIQGLGPQGQAELVALLWLGRGDGEVEEFEALVAQAHERREVPSETYLLDHPHLADHWAEALDKLGLGGRLDEVEERSGPR